MLVAARFSADGSVDEVVAVLVSRAARTGTFRAGLHAVGPAAAGSKAGVFFQELGGGLLEVELAVLFHHVRTIEDMKKAFEMDIQKAFGKTIMMWDK